jgi:RNA polymerase sigma-B factor
MLHEPISDARPRSRHRVNSYDNIEPWFDKLSALPASDPHRDTLREQIIRRCLPLAEHIAARFAGRGETFEDLQQVARVGLVLSVDRFDVARQHTFLSFAVPTIMGEVRRHFRDYTWATRVPRGIKELRLRLGPATDRLAQRLGRMPTARELATDLSADPVDVTQAVLAGNAYQSRSMDPVTEEDNENSPILDHLGTVEHCYALTEDALAVRPLIAALPARQRRVLIMRFFESKTQSQIATAIGVSQMQVSRILSHTLESLREQALCDEPSPA